MLTTPHINKPSLTLFTKIAFCALFTADNLWHQYPISKYEHTPMPSQPTSMNTQLSAVTNTSMKNVNIDK